MRAGPDFDIRLFGRLRVVRADHTPVAIEGAKAQELRAYLLVYRRRAHRREALSEVLWPEAPAAPARKYVRQALWQLQLAFNQPETPADRRTSLLLVELE